MIGRGLIATPTALGSIWLRVSLMAFLLPVFAATA
jgi:hypothetical protein